MYNKNLNIAKIEAELGKRLIGVVPAANIYPGERPTDNPTGAFIVVSVPGKVYDKTAYGTALVSVDIYTPALAKGRKDTTLITKLHNKIYDLLPSLGKEYSFDLSALPEMNGGRDGQYFFVSRISLECIIKTNQT
jgi:hypothetical protein